MEHSALLIQNIDGNCPLTAQHTCRIEGDTSCAQNIRELEFDRKADSEPPVVSQSQRVGLNLTKDKEKDHPPSPQFEWLKHEIFFFPSLLQKVKESQNVLTHFGSLKQCL